MLSNILDRISFWSLFSVIILLPIFFLPFSKIPVETSKGLLLVLGLAISVIFYAAARFSDGKIVLPKSYVLIASLGVVLAFLVSTIFSNSPAMSAFGIMFDLSTFWFTLSMYLLMVMSAIVFKEKKHARMVLVGLLYSFAFVFVFQIFRIFLPSFLSFGILNSRIDSLIGSWNSFGLLSALTAISALFYLEFLSPSKRKKLFLYSLVTLSVIMAILVNFPLVWEMLGLFALIIFIYKISVYSRHGNEDDRKKNFPLISFIVIMISLLFFILGQFIGGYFPSKLDLVNLEVSPSFSSTMYVTQQALKVDPVFGVGPNNFEEVWSMHKPQIINNTQFWNSSFAAGSGFLPTLLATLGILGILTLLIFIVLLLINGIKMIIRNIKRNEHAEITLFFLLSLFLLCISFFYVVGITIWVLFFVCTGIFIGLKAKHTEHEEMHISLLHDPKKSFFPILVLVFIMIASAGLSFKYVQRFASVQHFGNTMNATDSASAFTSISKALSLHQNDLYLRTYTQVSLVKFNELIEKSKETELSAEEKSQLQTIFNDALAGANLATTYAPNNYLNWSTLGSVYYTVSLAGLSDAFDRQIEAYQNASKLNPKNPGLKLSIANAYLGKKMTTEAKAFVQEAIDLKPDYIDALLTMSQIERSAGNNASAISFAERALSYNPSNQDIQNYVNSLKGGTSTPATSIEENTTNN